MIRAGRLANGCFYRKATVESSKITVVLLHGKRFSSKIWEDIGTLGKFVFFIGKFVCHTCNYCSCPEMLGDQRINAIAIDLPGFGESSSMPVEENTVKFMSELLNEINGKEKKKIVLVSPSMSGRFSLPFLLSESGITDMVGSYRLHR